MGQCSYDGNADPGFPAHHGVSMAGRTHRACHPQEAEEETRRMLEVYKTFAQDFMAMPVITGVKTESERFFARCRRHLLY